MLPKKLYKYRKFDARALKIVTQKELYYADPKTFNDPMDCCPTLHFDISLQALAKLLVKMTDQGFAEKGSQLVNHAVYNSRKVGDYKTDPDAKKYLIQLLLSDIKKVLDDQLQGQGILSFAGSWDSQLMWSHYADEHRGLCFEFETAAIPHPNLAAVDYNASRTISVSDLYAWRMGESQSAKERVINAYFYAKAPDWRYEGEWRDRAEEPKACGAYNLTAVYFGLKCEYAVQVAIVKMLAKKQSIDLYDIILDNESFDLRRNRFDRNEVEQTGISEPRDILVHLMCSDLEDLAGPDGKDILASLEK